MMSRNTRRNVSWINAARKDFELFPQTVQLEIKSALTVVAEGKTPDIAKPMRNLDSGVFEIAIRYQTDAYRVIYAVQIDYDIWVVHAFKKKSRIGIKTPKPDIDLIRYRIKRLKEML